MVGCSAAPKQTPIAAEAPDKTPAAQEAPTKAPAIAPTRSHQAAKVTPPERLPEAEENSEPFEVFKMPARPPLKIDKTIKPLEKIQI